jgi:hypothetical protein
LPVDQAGDGGRGGSIDLCLHAGKHIAVASLAPLAEIRVEQLPEPRAPRHVKHQEVGLRNSGRYVWGSESISPSACVSPCCVV